MIYYRIESKNISEIAIIANTGMIYYRIESIEITALPLTGIHLEMIYYRIERPLCRGLLPLSTLL